MKYSDRFFRFPIRIYDGHEIKKSHSKSEYLESLGISQDEEEEDEPAKWVQSILSLGYWELENMIHHEGYSRERGIDGAIQKGNDITVIIHKALGEVECMWNTKKFIEELDEFVAKFEAESMKEAKAEMKEFRGVKED